MSSVAGCQGSDERCVGRHYMSKALTSVRRERESFYLISPGANVCVCVQVNTKWPNEGEGGARG